MSRERPREPEGRPIPASLGAHFPCLKSKDMAVPLWALSPAFRATGHPSSGPAGRLGEVGAGRGQGCERTASRPLLPEVGRLVTVLEYQGPEQCPEPGFANAIIQRVGSGLSAGSLRKADTVVAEPVMDELMGRQLSRGGDFAARTADGTYPDCSPGHPHRKWHSFYRTKLCS